METLKRIVFLALLL
jgi:quercetin dioxygenase-like cupin family protein